MGARIIFHVDVNSAFLSWEAVRRLKEGESLDLRTIPSAVGGDTKTRHGIITAKSIPAKAFGVETGEPVVSALKKCPDLLLVPSDFALYEQCSRDFRAILYRYTDRVEPFSIDECFMDVTDLIPAGDHEKAAALADEIRETIKKELLFTVNVGIGENKLLAKTASDFKKPDRTHTLWQEELEKKFWPLEARDLLFVGRQTSEHLKTLGIRTIKELAKTPESILIAHFGEKAGRALKRSANGMDDSPVQNEREDAKSYGNSSTEPYDLTTLEEVRPELLRLSEKVAGRMRRDGIRAGLVTVTLKTRDFNVVSRQRKLDYYTSSGDQVYKEALKLFEELWDHETPIRLLGVSCGNLSDGTNEQLSLFQGEKTKKQEKLDKMLDGIREKYGKNAVMRSSALMKKKERKDPHD